MQHDFSHLSLEEIYKYLEIARSVGDSTTNMEAMARLLEEKHLQEQVLPALQGLDPLLRPIHEPFCLVIDYDPDKPLSLRWTAHKDLTHLQPLTASQTPTFRAPEEPKDEPKPEPKEEPKNTPTPEPTNLFDDPTDPVPQEPNHHTTESETKRKVVNPYTVLKIQFPNGKIIYNRQEGTDSFCRCLEEIGFQRVRALQIKRASLPLIMTSKDPFHRGQREVDGYYIYTNLSTQDKKKVLDEISDRLHLGLQVEVVKKG